MMVSGGSLTRWTGAAEAQAAQAMKGRKMPRKEVFMLENGGLAFGGKLG